jgi:hypothetical protein
MAKFTGKFSKIAIAAAVTGALVLPASAAFAGDRKDKKTERAIVGALIGGIAGAALSDGDKGTIAVAALAGAAIGASTGDNRRDPRYAGNYNNGRYTNGYGNTGYGNTGYGYGNGNNGYANNGYGYSNNGYGNSGYGNSGYGYSNSNAHGQDRAHDRRERRDRRQDSRYDYYGPRR